MSLPADLHPTVEEFVAWEAGQEASHEYVAGEVVLMSGASESHELVSGELFAAVRMNVRGTRRPCRVFKSDRMLRIGQVVRKPDVMVCCAPAANRLYEHDATYIAEILSPTTKGIDLASKLTEYGQLASIREYLLIDPDTRRVLLYRRHDLGWNLLDETGKDAVEFGGSRIDIAAIFAYVDTASTV